MRYHLDTIPVWDALKLDGECLFCALERHVELGEAERYLGASVMEPDTRVQVNEKGFCTRHHAMLFSMSNRLGHALMLESHTAETIRELEKSMDVLQKSAKTLENTLSPSKNRSARDNVLSAAEKISAMESSCIMCDSIQENMKRYLHTFFHLWKNDEEFRNRFASCKGVCLKHLAQLISIAEKELSNKELSRFLQVMTGLEKTNMDRIQEDISWFIKKFDYRYENESWKNSKDAVERTVNKLRSWCVGKEPCPED